MSFDVNNFSMSEPVIKAAVGTNNDGGSGGNLGYMGGGGRQKDQNKGSLFEQSGKQGDSFELSSKLHKEDYMSEPEKKETWFGGLLSKNKKEL